MVKRKWDEVSCQIARSLSQYAERNVHTQYVLRDVHREHILFSKGQPAGLIDFDAVRVDTPSTDLARWVASFLGENMDNDRVWDAALAGFRGENTLKSRVETEIDPGMARDLLYASDLDQSGKLAGLDFERTASLSAGIESRCQTNPQTDERSAGNIGKLSKR